MFESGFKESILKEIQIKDVSFKTFQSFLYFLYSDELDTNAEENITELIELSLRFFAPSLLTKIQWFLSTKIQIENACEIFQLASHYSMKELSDFCLRWSSYRMAAIETQRTFKKLPKELQEQLMAAKRPGTWLIEDKKSSFLISKLMSLLHFRNKRT